jgi:hypothetical protein
VKRNLNWPAIFKDTLARSLSITEVAIEQGVSVPTVCKAAARRQLKLTDKRGWYGQRGGRAYHAPRPTKFHCPDAWGLTKQEAQFVAVLVDADGAVSHLDMIAGIADGGSKDKRAGYKLIDVIICRARKKLAPFSIEITRLHGAGILIAEETKAKLRAGAVTVGYLRTRPPQERAA